MHLGIIMDGNGRWAVQRRLPRAFGHKRGASRVTEIVRTCPDLNIKLLLCMHFQLKIGNALLMKWQAWKLFKVTFKIIYRAS